MSELHSANCNQPSEENKEEYVCCDVCDHKDINPNDLTEEEYNLALIGAGYCHEYCMTEDMEKDYEEALKN